MTSTIVGADTPFEVMGGGPGVRRLVNAFYDIMDTEPAYARLRALHASDLTAMRESLSGFLAGWLGGPRDWFTTHPGVCMMSLHRAMPIDAELAGQWTSAMAQALAAADIDPELVAALSDAFDRMAGGMTTH